MGTGSEYYVNDVALALPSYDDQSSNPRYRLVSPAQVPLLVCGCLVVCLACLDRSAAVSHSHPDVGEKSQLNEWEYHFVGKYRGYWKINDFCVLSILTSGKSEGLNMV